MPHQIHNSLLLCVVLGTLMSPCCSLTVLQAVVDWQDTPKDVFISILKLIGFVMLFIDEVFPNLQTTGRRMLPSQYLVPPNWKKRK